MIYAVGELLLELVHLRLKVNFEDILPECLLHPFEPLLCRMLEFFRLDTALADQFHDLQEAFHAFEHVFDWLFLLGCEWCVE